MSHFASFDPKRLATFNAEDATKLFRSLLWCSARRANVPIGCITITTNTNVADGGIDAEVTSATDTTAGDPLVRGNSFFQLKAGGTAVPWRKSWLKDELFGIGNGPSKAALGSEVRRCLAQKGRYVLVCFGCDPTSAQRRKVIELLAELLRACGYKKPRVDVWGQSTLGGLIEAFPSLCLRITDRHHLPFLTHDDWRLENEMSRPLHLGKEQQDVIHRIRDELRGTKIGHIRLIGEPGLGKTRLALEALATDDLSPTVVYARSPEDFERSPLFNALVRSDDPSVVTLVIDDCAPKERSSIWNAIRQRSDRIRLIALDHGPETSADIKMLVLDCPKLDNNQIKAILSEYIGPEGDVDRWAEFCSGSPRVAHAVGENLRSNPNDILKPPATVPLWDRFIHGSSRVGGPEESEYETVLRYIALFHKFGYETPLEGEAKYIAQLVCEADRSITWQRFQSIVKHFRDRRILQGKTTLFLVPKALHVHLWLQFWEHFGHGINLADLLGGMPASLFRYFSEMLKYGHASERSLKAIEEFTAHGGPFDNIDFIATGPGALILNELAEAHPEATLRCIERTIGSWSSDQLRQLSRSRQYIVWALEKIAMWADKFRRAAMMLQKLALADGDSNTSNATRTFCGLFTLGYGRFASSEATPEVRLLVLREAVMNSNEAVRAIALKAVANGLNCDQHMKMIGPERQGIRPLPKLWAPKIWGELFEAYRALWQLIVEFRRSALDAEKAAASKVMVEHAYRLVCTRWMWKEVVAALKELREDWDTDLGLLVGFLARLKESKWHGLSRGAAAELRKLDVGILGKSLESRIRRLIVFGTWEDIDRPKNGQYGKKHGQMLRRLARAAVKRPVVLRKMLPELVAGRSAAIFGFGKEIAGEDQGGSWWPHLLAAFKAAPEPRNADLLAGYLLTIFLRDKNRWEATAITLLEDSSISSHVSRLVNNSGMTDIILNRLCRAVERGEVPAEVLATLGYSRVWHGISNVRCIELIQWCVERGTSELIRIALDTAYHVFCFGSETAPIIEEPLLGLLLAPAVFTSIKNHEPDHEWAELAKKYVDAFPQHAVRLMMSVLDRFEDDTLQFRLEYSAVSAVLCDFIRRNRQESWAAVASRLDSLDSSLAVKIGAWLGPPRLFGGSGGSGPLALFDQNDVLQWIDVDPINRASFIARECPKTLSSREGGSLPREILIRYGHYEEVQRAFHCNFGSDGWCGKESEHHRSNRDKMRSWLAEESAHPVIDWLDGYIRNLDGQIKDAEMREEREF